MPIKINVPFEEKDEVKKLGGYWMADEKTWVIPNHIEDINPFTPWLPKEDSTIVKFPYLVAKHERLCWKCRGNTPLIGLVAKNYFTTIFGPLKDRVWEKYPYPILFADIEIIHRELVSVLEIAYPFFQLKYSKTLDKNVWVNTCIHCQTIQPDNYNLRDDVFGGRQGKLYQGKQTELLKLKFDYHIVASIYEGWEEYISG